MCLCILISWSDVVWGALLGVWGGLVVVSGGLAVVWGGLGCFGWFGVFQWTEKIPNIEMTRFRWKKVIPVRFYNKPLLITDYGGYFFYRY